MAWLGLLLIAIAFGGMALAFGWSEWAEERRILARAEAILARGSIVVDAPARGADDALAPPAETPDESRVPVTPAATRAPEPRVRSVA